MKARLLELLRLLLSAWSLLLPLLQVQLLTVRQLRLVLWLLLVWRLLLSVCQVLTAFLSVCRLLMAVLMRLLLSVWYLLAPVG